MSRESVYGQNHGGRQDTLLYTPLPLEILVRTIDFVRTIDLRVF